MGTEVGQMGFDLVLVVGTRPDGGAAEQTDNNQMCLILGMRRILARRTVYASTTPVEFLGSRDNGR